MAAVMEAYKQLSSIVTELLLRKRKLNTSLAFISQSYFKMSRDIRLSVTHISWKYLLKENFYK